MLRFPYLPRPLRRPPPTLRGTMIRHLPILSVSLQGALGFYSVDCRVDSGADDTIFPLSVAQTQGIDLRGAPLGESHAVGGAVLSYPCVSVTLRISDGKETCMWDAVVGFISTPRRTGLIGIAGFLEYFDANLLGEQHELQLTPNGSFPGQHTVY